MAAARMSRPFLDTIVSLDARFEAKQEELERARMARADCESQCQETKDKALQKLKNVQTALSATEAYECPFYSYLFWEVDNADSLLQFGRNAMLNIHHRRGRDAPDPFRENMRNLKRADAAEAENHRLKHQVVALKSKMRGQKRKLDELVCENLDLSDERLVRPAQWVIEHGARIA